MFKNLKLGTKIMVMVICCIAVPTIIVLATTHIKSRGVKDLITSEIRKMSDSELTNISRGIYETIDEATKAAIKSSCMGVADNARQGVNHYYGLYKSGNLTEKEAKEAAADYLLSQKVGETGYIYVLAQEGKFLVHPNKILIGTDGKKYDFVKKQLSIKGAGFLEYMWKNPGESVERAKCIGQEVFDPWGWVISASAYVEEFSRIVKAQIEGSIRELIMKKRVGETGYVYVLGGKADQKGRYIISLEGRRDGEDVWDARDNDGNLFIQSIVKKATALGPGELLTERYPWKNEGDKTVDMKVVKCTYYAPWDWIIGAGVYEKEIEYAATETDENFKSMLFLISTVSLGLLLIGCCLGFLLTRSITKPIANIIEGLNEGADQVTTASHEVSSSSQSLAEGASEQAASVEETSSSLEEMASMTKQNAEYSKEADSLVNQASQIVAQANISMDELTASMQEISKASEETSKIIKTIDEIAFQTNLLALNAAVEAARAGEAGSGFAVVADEVRNLAMRAAEAAKNTAELIEGTMGKVQAGSDLVNRTNDAFSEMAQSTAKVEQLVGEIASVSREQAQGIDQINTAVAEMDKVIQQNAANAEESASASEELNGQAEQMREFVKRLVVLVGGSEKNVGLDDIPGTGKAIRGGTNNPQRSRKALSVPDRSGKVAEATSSLAAKEVGPEQIIPLDDKDFGEF